MESTESRHERKSEDRATRAAGADALMRFAQMPTADLLDHLSDVLWSVKDRTHHTPRAVLSELQIASLAASSRAHTIRAARAGGSLPLADGGKAVG